MFAASSVAPPTASALLLASRYSFGQSPPTPGLVPHAAGDPAAAQERPRALVVDDAPDVTEMIAMLLKYAGYDVVTVYSGAQALAAARTEQFDALISDIGMPGMSGYELATQVRTLPGYEREGKSYLSIALGCRGGRHRSVVIGEQLGQRFRRLGHRTAVHHRDVDRAS